MNKKIIMKGSQEGILLSNIPAFRQAFFVASLMITGGILLSHYVHHYFMIVPFVVSGGLLFSGLVGWCPMALLLQKMPWNKE